MVKITVTGIAGRMGGIISRAVINSQYTILTGGVEAPGHPTIGKRLADVINYKNASGIVEDDLIKVLNESEVLIEFTTSTASITNLKKCAKIGKPAIIGTTGFNISQKKELIKIAQKIAIVLAPNMSIGMNLIFKTAPIISKILGIDYAVEVIEAHHKHKKDAPSGSAIKILEEIAKIRNVKLNKVLRHHRYGTIGERDINEIGINVIRGGDIIGDHTIYFIGNGERVEITHRAHSRDTFAQGAIRAALWIINQKPGLYDMTDVLNLNKD